MAGLKSEGSVSFLHCRRFTPIPVCPGSRSVTLRVGCLNVRRCCEVEKMDGIGLMFEEKTLNAVGLSETKIRGERRIGY